MRGRVAHLAGALSVAVSLALAAPQTAYGDATEFSTYDVRAPGSYRDDLDVYYGPRHDRTDTTFLGRYDFGGSGSCDTQGWVSVDLSAGVTDFGNFAGLSPGNTFSSDDPCGDYFRCVWAFVNGSTDTYDCGSHPAQSVIPHGNPTNGYLHNEVISPAIPLAGTGSRFAFSFTYYRDLPLENLVFHYWRVRSITDGVVGPWRDHRALNYGSGENPAWAWYGESFGDLVAVGADSIQIAIGVVDMKGEWGGILGDGSCHSHSPLIGPVQVYRETVNGPQWFAHPIDLLQDAFPSDGTRTGFVRMDAARDIAPRGSTTIHPGDSLVVSVGEPTVGLDYHVSGVPSSGPAVYLHVRDVSPEKSGAAISGSLARWPVVEQNNEWTVLQMDSVRGPAAAPNLFCVDLNDSLYTPPDVVYYYFSARDANQRTTYWSSHGGVWTSLQYRDIWQMEMTCLPTKSDGAESLLFVDGAGGNHTQVIIESTFKFLAIENEVDRYDIRGPDYLASNGPGSRVTQASQQVASYHWIIWNTGSIASGTPGDGSGLPGKAPDLQLMEAFLDQRMRPGGIYLSGNNIATGIARSDPGVVADLGRFIDFTLMGSDAQTMRLGINPFMEGSPCSPFVHPTAIDTFVAYGGCPSIAGFDVLGPASTFGLSHISMHYGTDSSKGAMLRQRATNAMGTEVRVIVSGVSHHVIANDRPQSPPDYVDIMRDVLLWLASVADDPTPGGPPLLSATATDKVIEITVNTPMTACDNFAAWRIYREPDVLLYDAPVTPQSVKLVDTTAVVGADNVYRLVGVGVGDMEKVIATAHAVLPIEVAQFQVTARDLGIAVSWDIPDANLVSGFSIWRRDDSQGTFANVVPDSVLAPGARSFLDTSVQPRQQYDYMLVVHYSGGAQSETAPESVVARAALLLAPNAPNPFNPSTRIVFVLPDRAAVEIAVFDVAGRRVTTLVDGERPAGYNTVEWDGTTASGARAGSGIYFCRMVTAGEIRTHKMTLVK